MYINRLRYDQDLMKTHPKLTDRLSQKLLKFPLQMMPESAIVRNHSVRSAFIAIFEKYIGDEADWEVHIKPETREQIITSYRRLRNLKASTFTCDFNLDNLDADVADDALPLGITGLAGNDSPNHVMTKTMLPMIVSAVDYLMTEVVNQLDDAFNIYRETEVITYVDSN